MWTKSNTIRKLCNPYGYENIVLHLKRVLKRRHRPLKMSLNAHRALNFYLVFRISTKYKKSEPLWTAFRSSLVKYQGRIENESSRWVGSLHKCTARGRVAQSCFLLLNFECWLLNSPCLITSLVQFVRAWSSHNHQRLISTLGWQSGWIDIPPEKCE